MKILHLLMLNFSVNILVYMDTYINIYSTQWEMDHKKVKNIVRPEANTVSFIMIAYKKEANNYYSVGGVMDRSDGVVSTSYIYGWADIMEF